LQPVGAAWNARMFRSHGTQFPVIPSEVEESRGDTFGFAAGSFDSASLRSG
jgi:hypothetical protein